MQSSGTFPALTSGMRDGHPYGNRGKSNASIDRGVAAAQTPNPIASPRRRRQLVQPQPKVAANPLGAITANPALAAMVGRALNVRGQ